MTLLKRLLFISLAALLITGCATPNPYDYSALKASKPRSIVIIPPNNHSLEVNAPYIYLSTLTRPLVEKGYYVFPVAVIDQFLKENGLLTLAEMNAIPLDKIKEHIGADAVLYITINQWGQKFQLTRSANTVSAMLKLVDTQSGKILWRSTAFAQHISSDGGGDLVGALISAVITQIAHSTFDNSPQIARQANNYSINNQQSGLLNGPYKKKKTK